jgi:hypothetical protein
MNTTQNAAQNVVTKNEATVVSYEKVLYWSSHFTYVGIVRTCSVERHLLISNSRTTPTRVMRSNKAIVLC